MTKTTEVDEPYLHEYITDPDGWKVFDVRYLPSEQGQSMILLNVYEVTGWSDTPGYEPLEWEHYCKVIFKWDSCTHFTFRDQTHLCGVKDFKRHVLFMRGIYDIAFRIMGVQPQQGEEWTD